MVIGKKSALFIYEIRGDHILKTLRVNQAASDLTGYSKEELLHKSPVNLGINPDVFLKTADKDKSTEIYNSLPSLNW